MRRAGMWMQRTVSASMPVDAALAAVVGLRLVASVVAVAFLFDAVVGSDVGL